MIAVLVSVSGPLGLAAAPLPRQAQLFGPSDEEKAHEAAQDQGIKDIKDLQNQQAQDERIRSLEDKVAGPDRKPQPGHRHQ